MSALSNDLQEELTSLAQSINQSFGKWLEETVEKANRPNFETIYDDISPHSEFKDQRICYEVDWHSEMQVAVLSGWLEKNNGLWGWSYIQSVLPTETFVGTRSASIRWAIEIINAHKASKQKVELENTS